MPGLDRRKKLQKRIEITWLVTFCGQLLRMRAGERACPVATVEVPEVLMGEHQNYFVSPTCADAQVFFISHGRLLLNIPLYNGKPPGNNHDLKHSFPVIAPAFFV